MRKKLKGQVSEREKSDKILWSLRSWQGKILSAIISRGRPLTWKEIHAATGLDEKSLNKALSDLISTEEIYRIDEPTKTNVEYQVAQKLYATYSEYYNKQKTKLIKWISQWKEVRKLDFSLENEHFFLEGMHLDDFSKELVCHAESEVLVVNPFIQDCDLSNTLRDAKKRGVNVLVITRSPRDKHPEYLKNKQEYLSKLDKEGIKLVYSEKVHAKIIVVDKGVAIISSMNFYPESSAGVSWEAGLVSTDTNVVESIVDSLSKLD